MSSHRLWTRRELLPLLEARGIRPRREKGQNFLLDPNLLDALVCDAGVTVGDIVLEVGPGAGNLTACLVERADIVVAVEIDRGLAALCAELLADVDNLALLRADIMGRRNALNADVLRLYAAVLAGGAEARAALEIHSPGAEIIVTPRRLTRDRETPDHVRVARVVANLPYSISSPVIIALLESGLPFVSMHLLLQLEVARKLAAKPGTREWGLLSLLRTLKAEARVVREVSRACFWPQPKVDSALVEIRPLAAANALAETDYAARKRIAKGLFQYRRKRISGAARHAFGLGAEAARAWCGRAGVRPEAHAEELAPDDFGRLAAAWED